MNYRAFRYVYVCVRVPRCSPRKCDLHNYIRAEPSKLRSSLHKQGYCIHKIPRTGSGYPLGVMAHAMKGWL